MFQQNQGNNNQRPKAEGFLNIVLKDANGNEIRLPKGIPLDSNNRTYRSLINAAKKHAAVGQEFVIEASASVHLVDDKEDIPFGEVDADTVALAQMQAEEDAESTDTEAAA